ncbi:ABC transporter B family member 28 isoform X2 [Magnolia sinica]|uniref:ABC transporter B family member 28 isoform X2 n=1 Tax=Magnolia sinica TaxID=86752 RepID=UPI00265B6F32|nr:ABC transporter B family member 28 isoform X2 [Magnolia sinica]
MASATLLSLPSSLNLLKPSKPLLSRRIPKSRFPLSSFTLSRQNSPPFPLYSPSFPPRSSTTRTPRGIRAAYISAPASDPNVGSVEKDPTAAESDSAAAVGSPTLISWGVIWSLLAQHKLRLAVALASMIGCTTCTLSMPIFTGKFFEVLIGARPEPLRRLLTQVGVLYAMEPVFTVIFVINMNSVWEKVMATLRAQVFRRILIQKVEFFDRYKVGELTGLLTSDLGSLKDIVSENISRDRGLRATSEVVGTICILFVLSSQLAPVLALLMLSVSLLVALYKRSTVPIFKSHGISQARLSDCANETLSAIRTVRSFGGEKRQMSMFGRLVLAYQTSGTKLGTLKSANETLTRAMVYVCLLALYCLGGSRVKAGEMPVGIMASFIGYTFTLTFAVQGVVNSLGDLRGTLAAVERINHVLSGAEIDESLAYGLERELHKKELDDDSLRLFYNNASAEMNQVLNVHSVSGLKSAINGCNVAWSGDICLEDVHFSYPLRPDVEVLSGMNLMLKCGTVTALVGPSGAGKSTIVQLLARFYEPTRGRISVAGEDIRTFDKSEWAQVVSIVNQEPVLFSMSVGENIAYGLPDENVSKDDVIKAAKAANAHEFIISLPQGYDTLVGERGSLLSGGQRQATSALDTVSERLVQDALNHLMKGRTTLVIAHRLSTVQNAHQIAVCSDGRVMELGTHFELLARKGQYASLVSTQRLAFE